ncbi:MAG: hypothetical protein IPL53_17985 [Ignavibacteria bacterium]|nr:hypothetical protein [Ignavibacteria bacterium]
MKKIILLSISLIFLSYFYSCSSVTEVTGTWKKPATAAQKYNKICVLGASKDIVKRSMVEKAVVNQMSLYGINAVAGVNILPDNFIDSDNDSKVDSENKAALIAKLKEAGVDGVFLISLQDVKKSESYVPGTSYYAPYAGFYGGFYNNYWGSYNMVSSPGYYVQNTNYFLSSNFYNIASESLLWSAQSNTFDPQSLNDFTKSYASSVVEQFASSGVVKTTGKK